MLNPNMNTTKQYMLSELDAIVARFYGADTKIASSVRRMNRATIARLYEVAWLNRNDPLSEQINILNAWIQSAKDGTAI